MSKRKRKRWQTGEKGEHEKADRQECLSYSEGGAI